VQLTRENTGTNLIRAWENGRVRVDDRWIDGHVIVAPERIVTRWPVSEPAALTLEDLAPAVDLQPDIILLGTGVVMLLPDVDLMGELAAHGIGLEIMGTAAACRTYNVLAQEHRRVVAALFNDG
jgi:uncharacterized protein